LSRNLTRLTQFCDDIHIHRNRRLGTEFDETGDSVEPGGEKIKMTIFIDRYGQYQKGRYFETPFLSVI